jgi:hypothetical protein
LKGRVSLTSKYWPLAAVFCLFLAFSGPAAAVTIETRVAGSSDDAEENSHGKVTVDDVDLDLTYDRTSQLVAMRWTGLAIPPGATITAAYIQFTARISNSEATSLTIAAQASDNPATFSSQNSSLSARVLGPSIPWSPAAWTAGAAGVGQQTPSLTTIVQEIVNRPGWLSGNSVVLMIDGSGLRTAWAYDGNASAAPLLHIEYYVGPPPGPVEQVHFTHIGQTAVTFDWVGGTDTLRYGLTPAYGQFALASEPNPLPFSSPGPFREAKLTNLQPNTTYHYSIYGTPDHTFRTPPPRGPADFTIVAQGDVGAAQNWPQLAAVQARVASLDPAFVLMLGDLTYGDDLGVEAVDAHFNDMMVWSRDKAYMPCWGNHEWGDGAPDDMRNYKGRFDLPNPQGSVNSPTPGCCTEDWSWFDYGNVRFISYPEPYSGAWPEWATSVVPIMDAAQADTAISYIVTFGHQPAFSSGYHAGYPGMQTIMADLAASHSKYLLNLNGHSHNYERSHPQSGVVHVTAGTGGSTLETVSGSCMWEGGCPAPSWSAYRAMHHVVFELRFTPTAIEGKAYCGPAQPGKNDISCIEGTIIDSFQIPNPAIPITDPTAALTATPTSGVAPLTVNADASASIDPDGSIVSYRFDFGDGTVVGPQAQPTASHIYSPGSWTVKVTVTDNTAKTDTATAQVSVDSPATPNLVGNPSFETSTSGWNGYNGASLTRVPGTHDGVWACRLSGSGSGSFGINDSPAWVSSIPSAGVTYRFSAWVRSSSSTGSARLRITEYLGTTRIGDILLSSPVTLSTVWQPLSADFVTGASGSWFDLQVYNSPNGANESFEVDAISIRVPGSAVGVGDLPPGGPTVRVVPSPMRGPGTIAFTSTREGAARIEVFDLSGRRVAKLLDTPRIGAGRHSVGLGRGGPDALSAGVYLYRVSLDEAVLSGRFVLLP